MITVVVSVYNEEEMLLAFKTELVRVLKEISTDWEIIFVNDGSSDNSLSLLKTFHNEMPEMIGVINFSRNFGHEAAMIAGIDHAKGDAIICLDADLQHPPTIIPGMIQKFNEGFHIVNMVREKRDDNGWLKNKLSNSFYKFINRLSEHQLEENASDFFLISRKVANLLKDNFRERNRFLRGFIQIVGFKKTTLSFVAPSRAAGVSKYPFWRLIKLSVNAMIAFSKFPLYLGIYIGLFFAFFSVVLAVYTLLVYFFGSMPPSGYTTLVLFMSIGFSIMFILIGIIGAYVGNNFDESKKRPIYIIDDLL